MARIRQAKTALTWADKFVLRLTIEGNYDQKVIRIEHDYSSFDFRDSKFPASVAKASFDYFKEEIRKELEGEI